MNFQNKFLSEKFDLERIISQINRRLTVLLANSKRHADTLEIDRIVLKDIAFEVLPAVENFKEIKVFTHHLGVKFADEPHGKYYNFLTFYSPQIQESEYGIYYPDNFDLIYEEDEIRLQSKYLFSSEEEILLNWLNEIEYHRWFEKEYMSKVITILKTLG